MLAIFTTTAAAAPAPQHLQELCHQQHRCQHVVAIIHIQPVARPPGIASGVAEYDSQVHDPPAAAVQGWDVAAADAAG